MFEVKGLSAGYGKLNILRDINLSIGDGESAAVFGRNGAGKTTLAGALLGTVKVNSGTVELSSHRLDTLSTDQIVGKGVREGPQGGHRGGGVPPATAATSTLEPR